MSRFGEDPDGRILAEKLDEAPGPRARSVLPAFPGSDMDEFARAGATWALGHFYPSRPAADIIKAVAAGPAAHAR